MSLEHNLHKTIVGDFEKSEPSEQEDVLAALQAQKDRGKERIPNEREKTPEELELIKKVNGFFVEDFAELGLPTPRPVSPKQFHFVANSTVNDGYSHMDPMSCSATISQPEEQRVGDPNIVIMNSIKGLIHEATHLYAITKSYYNKKKKNVVSYRTGYHVTNQQTGSTLQERLRAFNEGVVDKSALGMLGGHIDDLAPIYNLDPEKMKRASVGGYNHVHLVNDIIVGVSKKTGESAYDVWKRIRRGQYTGEMMHLRDIEKAYGQGSLEVLDSAIADAKTDAEKERNQKVFSYFKAESPKERETLKQEILSPRK